MTETRTRYTATWDDRQGLYVLPDLGIWSEDGDQWHDDHGGHPAASEQFRSATITLVGGPRDGETVA